MRILFLGDIIGKPGRLGVAKILPEWRKKHKPDLVLANGENLAHGNGLTPSTFEELLGLGVDFVTTGNHWADKPDGLTLFENKSYPLIRPANWPGSVPGEGYKIINVGTRPVAIINLLAQVFVKPVCNSPFSEFDEIYNFVKNKTNIIIVDFHGEATSEKRAFGFYAAARASLVVGTHTHVPTADAQIIAAHTGYLTDLGMCGEFDSIIGVDKKNIIASFVDALPRPKEMPDSAFIQINAILAELDSDSGQCEKIARLDELVAL